MQQNLDIITRNFFRMMRSGAMNEYVEMEPMSPFKWRRLAQLIVDQNVTSVASRAVKNHQYEQVFNMPAETRQFLHDNAGKSVGSSSIRLELNNRHLNKKLQKIHTLEKHSDTYSRETLELFDIIIANCHAILNRGTSMLLIIKMGNHIRINSANIDYTKISRWLKDMQMQRVADLAGTILIDNFAFKKEEIPFIRKTDSKAAFVMSESINNRLESNHNRGITYFEYAPLENASIILGRLKGRLDSIEE